ITFSAFLFWILSLSESRGSPSEASFLMFMGFRMSARLARKEARLASLHVLVFWVSVLYFWVLGMNTRLARLKARLARLGLA
ncbi:hypothetical protein A2U01_0031339, partial [Trifolium medium]|nr:hypothetical protein [Trifolium medium]